jgi:DNA-3-methyladenine glycosylase II
VKNLKSEGGGQFKYMAEKDMLELAAIFAPHRSVSKYIILQMEIYILTVVW